MAKFTRVRRKDSVDVDSDIYINLDSIDTVTFEVPDERYAPHYKVILSNGRVILTCDNPVTAPIKESKEYKKAENLIL